MKENDLLMVISDKESMLNDIPAMCSLVECELVKKFTLSGLMIFVIKNKRWE
jgi:TusA-related sulfurtransferase